MNQNTPLEDIVIHGHFFIGSFDWYVAEFDGKDTFWGFVNLGDPLNAEWGPFLLSELRELRMPVPIIFKGDKERTGKIHIEVDWDKYWTTRKFSEITIPGLC